MISCPYNNVRSFILHRSIRVTTMQLGIVPVRVTHFQRLWTKGISVKAQDMWGL